MKLGRLKDWADLDSINSPPARPAIGNPEARPLSGVLHRWLRQDRGSIPQSIALVPRTKPQVVIFCEILEARIHPVDADPRLLKILLTAELIEARCNSLEFSWDNLFCLPSSLSDLGLIFLPASILPRIKWSFFANEHCCDYTWRRREIFRHPPQFAALGERSAQAEHIHSLDVPAISARLPLAENAMKSTQQELAKSDHRFDDTEHRFRGLLVNHRVVCRAVSADAKPWPQPGVGFSGAGGGAANRSRHLGLQLRLDLPRMLIGQRAVAAGVGMSLPSSATVPNLSTPISRATSSTRTNSASMSLKRRRNVAMVS